MPPLQQPQGLLSWLRAQFKMVASTSEIFKNLNRGNFKYILFTTQVTRRFQARSAAEGLGSCPQRNLPHSCGKGAK